MKDNRFSPKRLEEAAKTHDVLQRARTASNPAMTQAADKLRAIHDRGDLV